MVPWIATLVLTGVLLAAAVFDSRSGEIPNALTYLAALGGLLFWLIVGLTAAGESTSSRFSAFFSAGAAMLMLLIPFGALWLSGMMGGGDAKLLAAMGAWLGTWEAALAATFYFLLAGLFLAIGTMIARRRTLETMRRLWALLVSKAAGAVAVTDEPEESRLPYAIAIAAGGILAGAEYLLEVRYPWSDWMSI
ncbi:MAG: prepilin peptidase [Phycisphaeraceae bacterium]|nr:prepilin peptidase [Phycisphaeraceae bacterium]